MANERKLNNVRFQLDFGMIPKIFYRDPVDFVLRTRRVKGDYICALWNRYYEMLNPIHFPDNPKHFSPADFSAAETALGRGKFLLQIDLPKDHEGSLEYCLCYFIAFQRGLLGPKKVKLYALERNLGGVLTIGAMEPDGTHTTLGAAGTGEENIRLITETAFG